MNETGNINENSIQQSNIGEIGIEDKEEKKSDNQKDSRPWLFKKGQSGNPKGRPKGKTLKEYCRDFLACQTEEERQEFLNGMDKETIWKMAEGNPEMKTDITSKGESINSLKELSDAELETIISQRRIGQEGIGEA